MDVNIFTAMMKTEFLATMQAVAEPAPFAAFTLEINSTARIENFPWMTPAPGISEYRGYRRFASLDQVKYTLTNRIFDSAFSVPLRDIEDDLVGGYKYRMADLAVKAKDPFKAALLLETLAAGKVTNCFDGTAFFAAAHNQGGAGALPGGFGGGGNLLTFTASVKDDGNDGQVYVFCILIHNGVMKPMLYLNRKAPRFMTDAGTQQSEKAQKADYWIQLEAQVGYGYWWDAIRVEITNTPTLLELQQCIDGARQMFRRYTLPTALPTDPLQRVHEQLQFSSKVSTIVTDTHLEQLFNHLLYEDRVGVNPAGTSAGMIASNIYFNKFGLVVTGFLDTF